MSAWCHQEGSFAFVFKSQHFPDEIVAARRGSPLLVGVKTDRKLKVDFVDVELPTAENSEKRTYRFTPVARLMQLEANKLWTSTVANDTESGGLLTVPGAGGEPKLRRSQSRAFLSEDGLPQPIEFFVASDASAVIEHTKRVLYLEDDDIAHISEGGEHEFHQLMRGP